MVLIRCVLLATAIYMYQLSGESAGLYYIFVFFWGSIYTHTILGYIVFVNYDTLPHASQLRLLCTCLLEGF